MGAFDSEWSHRSIAIKFDWSQVLPTTVVGRRLDRKNPSSPTSRKFIAQTSWWGQSTHQALFVTLPSPQISLRCFLPPLSTGIHQGRRPSPPAVWISIPQTSWWGQSTRNRLVDASPSSWIDPKHPLSPSFIGIHSVNTLPSSASRTSIQLTFWWGQSTRNAFLDTLQWPQTPPWRSLQPSSRRHPPLSRPSAPAPQPRIVPSRKRGQSTRNGLIDALPSPQTSRRHSLPPSSRRHPSPSTPSAPASPSRIAQTFWWEQSTRDALLDTLQSP